MLSMEDSSYLTSSNKAVKSGTQTGTANFYFQAASITPSDNQKSPLTTGHIHREYAFFSSNHLMLLMLLPSCRTGKV